MRDALRQAVTPLYLLLCLIFGGSAQGIWANAGLQLLAVAMIAWTIMVTPLDPLDRAAKWLFALVGLTVLLVGIQLLPLPPDIWTALPGRDFIAQGFALMGQPLPSLAISLTPYETMTSALTLLPPIAVLLAMLRAGAYSPTYLAVAVLVGTLAAVFVGVLQVGSADPVTSPWYFYQQSNWGKATGFFANSNHMAALLVICVPILFALVIDLRERSENSRTNSSILLLLIGGVLVLLVGIALNGSLAVLLLGPPVLVVSASMMLPPHVKLLRLMAGLAVIGAAGSLLVYLTPLHDRLADAEATSVIERQTMWSNTAPAVLDYFPVGSGISSFRGVYQGLEDPRQVTLTYTSHAHNDYLEIALETGLAGVLLLFGFILWWISSARSIWSSQRTGRYGHAATIATAALLLHSVVDYPLRTAALSAIMAACLALMVDLGDRRRASINDLWRTRHLTV